MVACALWLCAAVRPLLLHRALLRLLQPHYRRDSLLNRDDYLVAPLSVRSALPLAASRHRTDAATRYLRLVHRPLVSRHEQEWLVWSAS
jgi:hypothetical protein